MTLSLRIANSDLISKKVENSSILSQVEKCGNFDVDSVKVSLSSHIHVRDLKTQSSLYLEMFVDCLVENGKTKFHYVTQGSSNSGPSCFTRRFKFFSFSEERYSLL